MTLDAPATTARSPLAGGPGAARAVLVAYASRAGSTREIAQRIAAVIAGHGRAVDLRLASQVGDVGAYQALVIGSPVYDGSWLPEAAELLRRNLDKLGGVPVWLFSVGAFGDDHRVLGGLMKKEPREMSRFRAAIRPRAYRVFAGVIAAERWPLYGKLFLWLFGGKVGDNRDWRGIERWAAGIASSLGERAGGAESLVR